MKNDNFTLKKAFFIGFLLCFPLFGKSQTTQLAPITLSQPISTATQQQASVVFIGNANPIGNPTSPTININGAHCASSHLMDAYLDESGLRQQYEAEYQQMVQNINYTGTAKASYTVPVIFHVVHNTAAENVSNADIMALFNRLNEDYQLLNADANDARGAFGFVPADVNVSFCLAVRDPSNNPLAEPGVHRVATSETYFDPDTEGNDMKYTASGGTPSWDRSRYINVWICDITNGASSGVAGYAYLSTSSSLPPSDIDGIVIDYNLGLPPDNSVLTHEMGHFLGLPHTWGNGSDGTGCTGAGDGVSDTPITIGPSFNYAGSCGGNQSTCGATQTQYENFMDYSNCTVMFTAGQASLMQGVLAGSRNSLTTSDACTPVNPTPPVTDFVADITTVISGGVVNFTDLSTNYPTSWSWALTPAVGWSYTGGTSSSSQNPKVQFTTAGTYTVALTASNSIGPDTETKTNYITVVAGGGGTTACDTLRNWLASDVPTYYLNGNGTDASWGFLPGTASIDINGDGSLMLNVTDYAEPFTASGAAQVRGMRLAVANAVNQSGTATVDVNVYSDVAGAPGAIIATQTVSFDDLVEGYWNTVEFTTPAAVTANFWIGYSLNYGSPQDTLVAFMAQDRGSGSATTFMNIDNGYGWNDMELVYSLFTSIFMDALLSNGPAPTAVLSLSNPVTCVGSAVSVNGYSSTNATDYEWYFDDGTNLYGATGGAFSFTLPAGTWTVELDAKGSCMTDVATTTLTVNPAIVPNITTTPENCNAADGSITAVPTGGNGGTYNVSTNSGATFDNSSPYNFTGLTAGTYTTIINDGTACIDTVLVTVNNVNTFNPTVSPGTTVNINAGDNVTLSVTGGVSWTWYEDVVIIGTTSSINVSPDTTTTYQVVVTNASGCEKTISITVIVTVLPPVADFTALPTTICAGETVAFSNASINAPTSYSWAFTGGTPSTSNATNPSVTYATPGVYNVTLTATNSAGSDIETKTGYITVNAIPTITGTTPGSRCGTGTVTLSATTSSGTISWYSTSTGGTALSTGGSFTTSTISTTTTYYVEATNAGGCTTPTRTAVTATVNPLPTIALGTTIDPSACGAADGSIEITGSGTGDVNWSGATSGSVTGVSLPFTIVGLAAGSYSITFTNTSGCVSTALNQSLSDPSAPTTPTITAGGATTFCSGGSVVLTSSAASGNTWSTGETTNSITVTTSGSYSVTVGTGCTATSTATVVTVNPTPAIPTISASGPTTFCDGGSVTLTSSAPSNNVWSTGATTNFITVNTSASVTVTTGTACTATSATTVITVNANPATPTISAGGATTFCSGGDVVLTSSSATNNTWSTGDTGNSITVNTSGNYTVTVSNASGCTSTSSSTTVTVNPIPSITSTTPGTRCGTGVVTLSATASSGTISWFANASGGSSLGTGNSFTTPSISTSATYFAEVNDGGCISTRTAVLADVVSEFNTNETVTVCSGNSYTFPDGTIISNIIATTSHTSVLTSAGGCDSNIVTTVNVQAIDNTVSTAGFTLTSNQVGATYQWLNCIDGVSIAGATSQSFSPTENGDYFVAITLSGCVDSSACYNITGLSIDELSLNEAISVYPNPSKGIVNLSISLQHSQDFKVRIYNLIGSLVFKQAYNDVKNSVYPINLSDKGDGVYLIRITGETGTFTKRIVVVK